MGEVNICLDCNGLGKKEHCSHINGGLCYTCRGTGLAPVEREIAVTKERSPSVAIIGSRRISQAQFDYIMKVAEAFVRRGYIVRTGCAEGVDHASMIGTRNIDPSKLNVYLPWSTYNKDFQEKTDKRFIYNQSIHKEWAESVRRYHPNPQRLSNGAFSMHARNWGIIMHEYPADVVVAMPANASDMGGTGQGIRIARDNNIPLFLVCNKEDRQSLKSFLMEHHTT